MFKKCLLARLLATVAALGLCVGQAAWGFPEETTDPGAPPSESPEHSGELFAFGSTFIFSFGRGTSVGEGDGFIPRAEIDCSTCRFPVNAGPHTFTLNGRVLGRIRNDNATIANPAVYTMSINIHGVRATVSDPVDAEEGFQTQSIRYTADLTGTDPFKAAITGTLVLDRAATQTLFPDTALPPEGENTISLGAEAGATAFLDTDGTDGTPLTFPTVPASSPSALGQEVPANVVFQVVETKRIRK